MICDVCPLAGGDTVTIIGVRRGRRCLAFRRRIILDIGMSPVGTPAAWWSKHEGVLTDVVDIDY